METTSKRRDVASTLRLNNRVTPRSIAYATTQVIRHLFESPFSDICLPKLVFSLNNSRDWKHLHAGFHYPSFYNFICDFFEEDQDPVSKQNVNSLLQWWNRYGAFLLMCILINFFYYRKIFPVTSGNGGKTVPRAPMVSSQTRLHDARARHARTAEGA